jgi:hypothetical protein
MTVTTRNRKFGFQSHGVFPQKGQRTCSSITTPLHLRQRFWSGRRAWGSSGGDGFSSWGLTKGISLFPCGFPWKGCEALSETKKILERIRTTVYPLSRLTSAHTGAEPRKPDTSSHAALNLRAQTRNPVSFHSQGAGRPDGPRPRKQNGKICRLEDVFFPDIRLQ